MYKAFSEARTSVPSISSRGLLVKPGATGIFGYFVFSQKHALWIFIGSGPKFCNFWLKKPHNMFNHFVSSLEPLKALPAKESEMTLSI